MNNSFAAEMGLKKIPLPLRDGSRTVELTHMAAFLAGTEACHVAGVKNVVADRESRTHNTDSEWCLKDKWFKWIVEQFGQPEVDLFADKYVAWRPDPHAICIDAFSVSCKYLWLYFSTF